MSEDGKKSENIAGKKREEEVSGSGGSESWANRQTDGTFGPGNTIGPRFKLGDIPNPNGRRGASKDILDKIGSESVKSGTTRKEKLLEKLYSMAEKGNIRALTEVLDRTEGKSVERQVVASYKPIKIFNFDSHDEEDPSDNGDT